MDTPESPPPSPGPTLARRAPWIASLASLLSPLGLAIVGLALLLWWIVSSSSGLTAVLHLANALTPQRIEARGVEGSLWHGLRIEHLSIRDKEWGVAIAGLEIEPRELAPGRGLIALSRASARRLEIDWQASVPATASPPPPTLALPFTLEIEQLELGEFALGETGSKPLVISELSTRATWDAEHIELHEAAARLDILRAQARGKMQSHPPYAMDIEGELSSALAQHEVDASLRIGGSLESMAISAEARAEATPTRASLKLEVTPFGAVSLGQLALELKDWELAAWFPGAPAARLTGVARLDPVADAPEFTLAGGVQLHNSRPASLDQGGLPVRSARGELRWSASSLAIQVNELLATRGSARGGLSWTPAQGLAAQAEVRGIDAATLWSSLAPTDANGRLEYALDAKRQHLAGDLRNASGLPLAARFSLDIGAETLLIRPSELRLGTGQAQVEGRLQLGGARAAEFSARLSELDLARLAPGWTTRLSGQLDFKGRLAPRPEGEVRLKLADSSEILGRPLGGTLDADLSGDRLEAQARLASRSTRVFVQGGLGQGRQLELSLEAPRLAELSPKLGGAAELRLVLEGDWRQPSWQMQGQARSIRLSNGTELKELGLAAQGAWDLAAPLQVDANLNGLLQPGSEDLSLSSASFALRGTALEHRIVLSGRNEARQDARLEARGGWREAAWRGQVLSAETSAPSSLRLLAPAELVIGRQAQSLGPAEFEFGGGRFTAVRFANDAQGTRTSGQFDGLRPQAFDPARREARRTARTSGREPLSLRGRWELSAQPQLNGELSIERAGGDIYAGVAALTPLGIKQLQLNLQARSNHLSGELRLAGAALGGASGRLEAWADTSGAWKLAADRPLALDLDVDLASLGWLGPMINDNVLIEGRAKASMQVRGSAADPRATGSAQAENLRLAWVEQGLRLENGSGEAVLEDGVLVLKKLEFTGPPRVKPSLAAAAEGIPPGPGAVRAFGRLALSTFAGSFALQAERLPVLQMPDRWIIASGDAGLALYGKRAELKAKLRGDGAYVDFNKLQTGPSLPDDVIVVRSRRATTPQGKAPIALQLDAIAELGPRFYIRGAGVESRLEGKVEVKGEAGALRAFGAVQTVGGTYAGYGQRLKIERGIVTFQGLLDNPTLNVLALRPALPVAVGVAITGTAQKPVIRLYSDPSMPEAEKLNWLVLGRAAEGTGQDRAMLAAAAGALFSGQSDAAAGALMRSLGIDEISLRGAQTSSSLLPRETVAGQLRNGSSATQEVVAVGKRIDDKLYLSFEQAITGASYALTLTYQLTQSLSLVGRAGTSNAIDLVWSFAFD